jgi:hypothetical protein
MENRLANRVSSSWLLGTISSNAVGVSLLFSSWEHILKPYAWYWILSINSEAVKLVDD